MAPTQLHPTAPTDDAAASQYATYMHTDEQPILQHPREQRVHPDELQFQVVHQGTEILLKLVTGSVEDSTALPRGGRPADVKLLLQRTALAISVSTQPTDLLPQMTPALRRYRAANVRQAAVPAPAGVLR